MKTMLLLLDGNLVAYHVADAAIQMARQQDIFIHAMFITHSKALDHYGYPFPNDLSLATNRITGQTVEEEDAQLLKDNIRLFEDKCREATINYLIDTDTEVTIRKLIDISMFADFIFADARRYTGKYHLADLLPGVHCPALLVPAQAMPNQTIVFTYDGQPASIHAIKTFTAIFPGAKDQAVELVYVAANASTATLPFANLIEKWMQLHYSNFKITIVGGEITDALVAHTGTIHNPLVVMGSFGRSTVSRFFHESLANSIIGDNNSSLFIAHAKQ